MDLSRDNHAHRGKPGRRVCPVGPGYGRVDGARPSVGTESRSVSVDDLGEQGGAQWKDLDGMWDLAGTDAQTHHTDPGDGLTGDICQTSRPHTSLHLPHVVRFNLWKL